MSKGLTMFKFRRLVAAVGVIGAAAGIVGLSGPTASAATPTYVVTVSTSFSVVDDDSTIFGASYSYASGSGPTQFATLGTDKNTGQLLDEYYNDRIRSVCAGNEVDGNLVTDITRTGFTNTAYVTLDETLYEGDSCHSSDNDGVGYVGFYIGAGQTKSGHFTVTNYREGTNDSVTVYYTVSSKLV
jgi:hypothetical protein